MVQFGTYHVWIEVDGDELPEFNVDVEEDKKKVTCWIPSEAGKVCCPPLYPSFSMLILL